jgi:2-desacetyl-2-hydroxyethyl bacteriochlorophyllide A dehydrogenase
MVKRVVFAGKQLVSLESAESRELANGQVRVKSRYSLISTGTENIVFNRLFSAGSHWDNWVTYPFYPGYSIVGDIVEVADDVTSLKVGDRVAMRLPHASEHVVTESECCPVPKDVDPAQAAWFALAKIAYMGALAADYELGDSVLVIGAGPIGQMSVRWAAAAGASAIIVVDPVAARLDSAIAGGATATIAGSSSDCEAKVRAANNGELPKIVIDGTGFSNVFSDALSLAAKRGTVVILGDTGFPAEQRLSSDVISRGLKIIGAHDGLNDDQWNNATISFLFFALVASGRFDLEGLNSHTFKPEQVGDAYELLNTRRGETMGVLFDWN